MENIEYVLGKSILKTGEDMIYLTKKGKGNSNSNYENR